MFWLDIYRPEQSSECESSDVPSQADNEVAQCVYKLELQIWGKQCLTDSLAMGSLAWDLQHFQLHVQRRVAVLIISTETITSASTRSSKSKVDIDQNIQSRMRYSNIQHCGLWFMLHNGMPKMVDMAEGCLQFSWSCFYCQLHRWPWMSLLRAAAHRGFCWHDDQGDT